MRVARTLVLILIGAVALLGFSSHPAHAQPAVPAGHPRVYVTPSDVPAMQAKLSSPGYSDWYAELADESLCRYSVCYAFRYLMGEPASVGETAVATSLAELQAVVDDSAGDNYNCENLRKLNNPVHYAALVYDWCYDLLSSQDKQDFIYEINRIVSLGCSPLGYDPLDVPPYDPMATVVSGHGSESWLLTSQLPAGVAIYDEAPELYDNAADYFLTKFVPVRDFFYVSHMHHQGDSYITSCFQNDMLASWLFERMGAGNVFDVQQQYVPYQIIYNMRPDYQQMRMGDTWNSDGRARDKRRILLLTGSYYDDPFQMYLVNHMVGSSPLYTFGPFEDTDVYRNSSLDRIFEFLFREPNAVERTIADLPKTKYFAEPMGEMVARTGWNLGIDSRDAVVNMRIGQYFFGSHQRKDFGTWQIYYRGALAITSGYYQHMGCNKPHFKNYYQQTVAHNGLLIYHPLDVMLRDTVPVPNDGGQQWPGDGRRFSRDLPDLLSGDFQRGDVTAQQLGPDAVDPHYSYIAGDITAGYSTTSVSRVTRSMVTFNTQDPSHPMVFMVFDRVTSTSAGLKKRWLVHSINEPTVLGSKIVIVQDADGHGSAPGQYGGKLVAHSLLPDQATLEKVGGPGQEFWIANPNLLPDQGFNWMWDTSETHPKAQHEVGDWRVEVSPTQDSANTLFLHAMTVQDATNPIEPGAERIHSALLVGARMADHAALFGRDGLIEDNVEITFDLPGVGMAQTLVCDLPSGFWCIRRNGNAVATETIPPAKTCLFFGAEPGLYTLDQDPDCDIASLPDAGVQSDGGGPVDDGAIGDAGSHSDTGPGDGQPSGCGCSTGADRASLIPLLLPLLLILLFLRRRVFRHQHSTGLTIALSAALWLCAGCIVDLPTPECDHDGDGFCSKAVGNMPGGDFCDQLGDIGCGDATQPETIYPGAPETCADIGIDNNCDGDAEEVEGLGDLCDTGICSGQANCPCQYGHLQCEAGELICDQDTEKTLDEPCNGVDNNCNGKDDSADDAAHIWCELNRPASEFGWFCEGISCMEGCDIASDCGVRGNRCYRELPSDTFGRCMCGDGPKDYACPSNFFCDRLEIEPFGYACLCGTSKKVCGDNEGCSVDGDCTCGSGAPQTIEENEACPDSSDTPDCCDDQCVNTNTDPYNCGDCGILCPEDKAVCCGGICQSSSACELPL